ncbi:MAG TPA: hypothetical protein VJH03_01935 [Blastocatellia bacterium]|nr:hypothetical protein [Blastocatellia bacterium]
MNRDLDEKRIEKLFHEMRADDQHRAPSFTRDWAAAVARSQTPKRFSPVLRLAAAAAMLVALGAFLLVFLRHSPRSEKPETAGAGTTIQENRPEERATSPISPTPSMPSPPAVRVRRPGSKILARRSRSRHAQSAILISQWRSPTDFLLRTPGDALLKTLPRVGGSVVEINAIPPREMN